MKNETSKSSICILLSFLGLILLLIACKPKQPDILLTETSPTQPGLLTQILETMLSPSSTFSTTPTSTKTPDWIKMAVGNKGLIEEFESIPGCQLPCWWGITPGETMWEDTKAFLSEINAEISIKPQPNNIQRVEIYIPVIDGAQVRLLSIRMIIESGIIHQIINGEYLSAQPGDLRSFLEENGKPDEVWVDSLRNNLGGPPPFDVWLFYWDKGIAAEFYSSEKRANYRNELIKACIEFGPIIFLWSNQFQSISEVSEIIPVDFDDPYYLILPVEEALGISVEQFYNENRNLDDLPQLPCFTSEKAIWPEL